MRRMEKATGLVHAWLILERVPDFTVMEIERCDPEQFPPFNYFSKMFSSPSPPSQAVSKGHTDIEKM